MIKRVAAAVAVLLSSQTAMAQMTCDAPVGAEIYASNLCVRWIMTCGVENALKTSFSGAEFSSIPLAERKRLASRMAFDIAAKNCAQFDAVEAKAMADVAAR